MIGIAAMGALALAMILGVWLGGQSLAFPALCGPSRWVLDLWIVLPLATFEALWLAGRFRDSEADERRGDGRALRDAAFLTGMAALAVALVSPLHGWGQVVFTAHMIEHEIVMLMAAPLLIVARPGSAFADALPDRPRAAASRVLRLGLVAGATKALTRPAVATTLHGLAIWLWHLPPPFERALADPWLHRFQHLAFLATALLFWWSLLRRAGSGRAAMHLFVTMLHTGALGALLVLAPRVLYPTQSTGSFAWGLSPLEDQQLAGLVMWVPAGLVYAIAALYLIGTWIGRSGAKWDGSHAAPR